MGCNQIPTYTLACADLPGTICGSSGDERILKDGRFKCIVFVVSRRF